MAGGDDVVKGKERGGAEDERSTIHTIYSLTMVGLSIDLVLRLKPNIALRKFLSAYDTSYLNPVSASTWWPARARSIGVTP